MVMRVWRAQATSEGAARYRDLFEQSILPKLQGLPGFRRAYLLNRAQHGGKIDIEVHTLWESVDAIRAFSGPDADAAVVPPEVQATVTSFETTAPCFDIQEYEL